MYIRGGSGRVSIVILDVDIIMYKRYIATGPNVAP